MQYAHQVKADVVNELRNDIHYDQLELKRLLSSSNEPHKVVVEKVKDLLKKIHDSDRAIELFDIYLPDERPAQEQQTNG